MMECIALVGFRRTPYGAIPQFCAHQGAAHDERGCNACLSLVAAAMTYGALVHVDTAHAFEPALIPEPV